MRTLLLSLMLASAVAAAAPPLDCAALGHPTGFGGTPTTSIHDFHDFRSGGDVSTRVVGAWCQVRFELQPGTAEPKPKDNVAFYLKQFKALGAKVIVADDFMTVARVEKTDTWIEVGADGGWGSAFFLTVVTRTPFVPSLQPPSGKDHRLFGHLPDYELRLVEVNPAEDFEFELTGGAPPTRVQGKGTLLHYFPLKTPMSDWDALENYQQAIVAKGGRILFRADHGLSALLEDKGQQIFVSIFVFGADLTLRVVEEQPIVVPVVDLKTTFEKTGKLVLYVKFEFNKATLQPESAPVLAQVVSLLAADQKVRVSVDGFTDDIGGADANQKLSEARAAAVVAALVKGGVAKARLSSSGHGANEPIAPNDTSAGRAKNRRVELVRQ